MVNTCTFMVSFGILLAGIANYSVSTLGFSQAGLRILIGVQFGPPILLLATLFLIPER